MVTPEDQTGDTFYVLYEAIDQGWVQYSLEFYLE